MFHRPFNKLGMIEVNRLRPHKKSMTIIHNGKLEIVLKAMKIMAKHMLDHSFENRTIKPHVRSNC